MRFGVKEKTKENFHDAKKPIKIANVDVNVGNIVTSKLIEIKTNSQCLIGIRFDKVGRTLVFTMPKVIGSVSKLKVEEGDYKCLSP